MATFNNISVISWRSVLLVEETAEYPVKTIDLSLTKFITRNVVSSTHRHEQDSNSQGTGSCKSNYHTITITIAPATGGERTATLPGCLNSY